MSTVIRSYPTERTIPPMHLNLSVPAWINQRPELNDSYKLFYGAIVNLIGNNVKIEISTAEMLKLLKCSTRNFSRHTQTCREHQLIFIKQTHPGVKSYQ